MFSNLKDVHYPYNDALIVKVEISSVMVSQVLLKGSIFLATSTRGKPSSKPLTEPLSRSL
ncbi:hypothetical protein DVH24_006212 [Malus domestica]|uniref:Uncharacterized protein n=1 Tax=Malus domestica TaxID=3750 RepID=A0A498KGR0_MALDO|nr:hypothetical protein DVH24_006212 [Malus domestica]